MRLDGYARTLRYCLSDGGLDSFMTFEKGFDHPLFSTVRLVEGAEGRTALTAYSERQTALARKTVCGFVMDTPTWPAGMAWAAYLRFCKDEIIALYSHDAGFIKTLRDRNEIDDLLVVLIGLVETAGASQDSGARFDPVMARIVHWTQMRVLADAEMVSAKTFTHVGEAAGMVLAAWDCDLPGAIAFALETDGCLPSVQSLAEAIYEVVRNAGGFPIRYVIDCSYPDQFRDVLNGENYCAPRVGGSRANVSDTSHVV